MTSPFYALVIPVSGGSPTHPIAPGGGGGGGSPEHPIFYPPGIWPGPGYPEHPIAPGGGGAPSHPIFYPPYPSTGPGFPSHPAAPGGGGGGSPTPPIYYPPYPSTGPGFPTHPAAPGGQPPGTWGGSGEPMPGNPIVIPPDQWPEKPPGPDEMVIVIYVPYLGYKMMVVPNPSHKPDQELPPTEAQPKS